MSRTGTRGNNAQSQYLQQQSGFLGGNPINGAPNMDQALRQATLGVPVQRQDAGLDLQGKYMGSGTYANQGKGLFSTKESVLMVPEWAQAFTQLMLNSQNQVQAALQSGSTDFSLGIYGILPNTQQAGFYVPGITQYYPDDRARVTISNLRSATGALDQRVSPYLLPGSTAARLANAQGYAVGLAYVKNPQNQTGYLRVGSKGYLDALAKYVNDPTLSSELDMQHLLGQGAVYGLGPIFNLYNLNIVVQPDQRDPSGQQYPVRFRLAGNANVNSVVRNASLIRSMQAFYNSYLKNPDQVRLGRYASAAAMLRNADKMTTGATGDAGDLNAVNQAVLNQWRQTGSVAGAARWGTGADGVNYADFNNRRGLTANPLRDAQGNAIARGQNVDRNAGQCNIYGSGPGVSQSASLGGQYGFRFTKAKRSHNSTRKGQQGTEIAPDTYFCADTPDYVINPDRKIYQAGGIHATPNQSLEQVLAAYGQGSADDLRARYADWTTNPEKYGTNPWFMLNPNTQGRGFSRAAPTYYSQDIANQYGSQAAVDFNNINLTQAQKTQRARQLAANVANLPTFGKTGTR